MENYSSASIIIFWIIIALLVVGIIFLIVAVINSGDDNNGGVQKNQEELNRLANKENLAAVESGSGDSAFSNTEESVIIMDEMKKNVIEKKGILKRSESFSSSSTSNLATLSSDF